MAKNDKAKDVTGAADVAPVTVAEDVTNTPSVTENQPETSVCDVVTDKNIPIVTSTPSSTGGSVIGASIKQEPLVTNFVKHLIEKADNELKGTLHALDLSFSELKVIAGRLENHASDDIKRLVQYIKSL